jgi:hypothetical protein
MKLGFVLKIWWADMHTNSDSPRLLISIGDLSIDQSETPKVQIQDRGEKGIVASSFILLFLFKEIVDSGPRI